MRATTHFARTTKGGKAFSSKHNDRNYSEELKPDNVIAEKSKDNSYHFCWFENEPQDKIKTFEDHEKWVYKNYWTEKQCAEFQNKLINIYKRIYYVSDYIATVKAQSFIIQYGLTNISVKNNPNYIL